MYIYLHKKNLKTKYTKISQRGISGSWKDEYFYFLFIMFTFFQIFYNGYYFMPKKVFLKACCKVLIIMWKMHLWISKKKKKDNIYSLVHEVLSKLNKLCAEKRSIGCNSLVKLCIFFLKWGGGSWVGLFVLGGTQTPNIKISISGPSSQPRIDLNDIPSYILWGTRWAGSSPATSVASQWMATHSPLEGDPFPSNPSHSITITEGDQ